MESKKCDFVTFDVPVKENCPQCGWTMFKKSGRGAKKPYCINEACPNFTPEENRGGWKKPAASGEGGEEKGAKGKKAAAKPRAAASKAKARKTAPKAGKKKETE